MPSKVAVSDNCKIRIDPLNSSSSDFVTWLMAIKRECPLGPSHMENMWHMMENQNFSYFAQR